MQPPFSCCQHVVAKAGLRLLRGGACLLFALLFGAVATAAPAAKTQQAPASGSAAPASVGLPGGASALSEVHSGWSVNCRTDGGIKYCSMAHQERSNGRVLLTLEVRANVAGTSPAALLLPFGLAVTQGVTLAVDDQKASTPYAFSTCLPGGCIVPLTLGKPFISQLSNGAVLKITATVADSHKPITFTVPLDGFAPALARVNELSAS